MQDNKFDFKEYRLFIEEIKSKIRSAQIKASFSVNTELIRLYWDIGCTVVKRQHKDGWGTSVIDRISVDIQREFPGIEGFSPSNISRMRTFYLTWKDVKINSAQLVPNLPKILTHLPWGCLPGIAYFIWYCRNNRRKNKLYKKPRF